MQTREPTDLGFVYYMIHDLKGLLFAAEGWLEMIEQAGDLNEKQLVASHRAQKNMGRMADMIKDVMEYARLESGDQLHWSLVDLDSIIQDVIQICEGLAQQRNIKIIYEALPSSPLIQADSKLIEKVIHNLVTNAIKYNVDDGKVTITLSRDNDTIRLQVADTGYGIPDNDQVLVFERFFRIKRRYKGRDKIEGTGLGLSIAKVIVERHGGSITLDSVVDQGTTFTVVLPLQGANIANPHGHEVPREALDDMDDNLQELPDLDDRDSRTDTM